VEWIELAQRLFTRPISSTTAGSYEELFARSSALLGASRIAPVDARLVVETAAAAEGGGRRRREKSAKTGK
jgi:hypothetical protein